MLDLRGIKARPHDLERMLLHEPSLVEIHASVDDLAWNPTRMHSSVQLAVHLPEYHSGRLLDPASLHEGIRSLTEQIYAHAVGRAIAWAPFFKPAPIKIIMHPGGSAIELDGAKNEQRLAQLIRTVLVLKQAAGDKAEILIENLPGHCWFFGGDWLASIMLRGTELRDFCSSMQIGCTLDLCHLWLAANDRGFNFLSEVRAAKPHVRHVHYSDGKGIDKEGLELGTGDLPLLAALQELQGIDATAVPEIWFGHEDGGAAFARAQQAAMSMMLAGAAHG